MHHHHQDWRRSKMFHSSIVLPTLTRMQDCTSLRDDHRLQPLPNDTIPFSYLTQHLLHYDTYLLDCNGQSYSQVQLLLYNIQMLLRNPLHVAVLTQLKKCFWIICLRSFSYILVDFFLSLWYRLSTVYTFVLQPLFPLTCLISMKTSFADALVILDLLLSSGSGKQKIGHSPRWLSLGILNKRSLRNSAALACLFMLRPMILLTFDAAIFLKFASGAYLEFYVSTSALPQLAQHVVMSTASSSSTVLILFNLQLLFLLFFHSKM